MTINLIIIGDEIINGMRQDKHMAKIIELLAVRGLSLNKVEYISDSLEEITNSLKYSFNNYKKIDDIIISCGGIGATPDDNTRLACANAIKQKLVLHPQAQQLITQKIIELSGKNKAPADLAHPENLQRFKMGEFPQSAEIIENPYNKIPGFSIKNHYFVPGFPLMAWPMVEAILDTKYKFMHNTNNIISRNCYIPLILESTLAPILFEAEKLFLNIKTYSLPSLGIISTSTNIYKESEWEKHNYIEIGVKGKSTNSIIIDKAFNHITEKIKLLGYNIYISK